MSDTHYKVSFQKVVQGTNFTAVVLSASDKTFAIYTLPTLGDDIQALLSKTSAKRPKTFDLIQSIFHGLEITPLKVLINDIEDTIYYTKLLLSQQKGESQEILEIDSRPSDSLLIALKYDLDVSCSQKVLENSPPFEQDMFSA